MILLLCHACMYSCLGPYLIKVLALCVCVYSRVYSVPQHLLLLLLLLLLPQVDLKEAESERLFRELDTDGNG